jgi:primosomal protein N' (replication factor Y)
LIVDVIFDIPRARAFTYRIPPGPSLAVGQRVRAPLHGKLRVGIVVACREGTGEGLKVLDGTVDPGPLLSPIQLNLCQWISAQSYSSWGSTCKVLLPPIPPRPELTEFPAPLPLMEAEPSPAWLLTGADREERLMTLLTAQAEGRGILFLVPEIEAARAWAERLELRLKQPVVRLDSGSPDRERWRGWMRLARGSVRVAVGTRSALLAPVSSPATLVLFDEHDPAHKPPGHPRIHSRGVALERARLEGHSAVLTSATPSVESWWQADNGRLIRCEGSSGAWPEVTVVDARGRLHSSPLSPELRRGIEETLARGGQVCLLVTRISSVLACGDCGFLLRCRDCEIPLGYSRARRTCSCRLCGRREPAPDICAHCLGRGLTPLGWGAERVEQAVRQAFPRLPVARYDGEAHTPARTRQLGRQWQEQAVRLVIGTRQALKALPPLGLQLVGVITPDHLLRLPDFRAGERAFALLWAAAEWAGGRGRLIIQTQHPDHYVVRAVAAQELTGFYKPELKFRAEVGYPPFRRLCLLTIRDRDGGRARALAEECWRELDRIGGLTVFPPAPRGRSARAPRWRLVVKGGSDLPDQLRPTLTPLLERRRSVPGVVEVEMDPQGLV